MNNQQKIIIQSFGLQAVQTGVYAGVIRGIEALNKIPTQKSGQYNGKLPEAPTQDPPIYTSALGTPVWDTLIIKSGSYIDTTFGKTEYGDVRLDTCLITISQVHNVILTPIQGRDGEVIEYIGKMSFRINVKGGLFGKGNVRPVSDITKFMLMMQSNQSLVVKESKFLAEWNITEFAILDKNIPQTMGGYNYQLFEFNAVQDLPVILAQQNA